MFTEAFKIFVLDCKSTVLCKTLNAIIRILITQIFRLINSPLEEMECCLRGKGNCNTAQFFPAGSEDDRKLLELRSGANAPIAEGSYLCAAHRDYYVNYYSNYYTKCVSTHLKGPVKSHLRVVTLDDYKEFIKYLGKSITPGKKLCSNCMKALKQNCINLKKLEENSSLTLKVNPSSQNTDSQSTSSESQSFSNEVCLTPEDTVAEQVDDVLKKLSLSPIKSLTKLKNKSSIKYAKEKMHLITDAIQKKIKYILHIPEQADLFNGDDSKDLSHLMGELRERIQGCDHRTQARYLTLVPASWTLKKIRDYFSVGKRVAKKAVELRNEKGILPEAKLIKKSGIDPEIVKRVKNFYCDDEGINSRILPGMKDKVRISKGCYEQKRLILCTLKELFVAYKNKYPADKIGWAKFCLLRPKQCVLPGASGTHSVCVCAEHQNFKLLLSAVGTALAYKDVVKEIVCNVDNRECMFRTCKNCPNRDEVAVRLNKLLLT